MRLRNTKDKGYVKDGLLKFFADELETQFFAINYTEEDNSILFWIQGDELAGEGKLKRWKSGRDGTFLKLPLSFTSARDKALSKIMRHTVIQLVAKLLSFDYQYRN